MIIMTMMKMTDDVDDDNYNNALAFAHNRCVASRIELLQLSARRERELLQLPARRGGEPAYELLQLPARMDRELFFFPADSLSVACKVHRTRITETLRPTLSLVGSLYQQRSHFVVHLLGQRARDVVVI